MGAKSFMHKALSWLVIGGIVLYAYKDPQGASNTFRNLVELAGNVGDALGTLINGAVGSV